MLLVRHFFGRFFDNEIVSQTATCAPTWCRRFGLVATPGIFVPFYMIPQRARFDHPFDHDWMLLSDYYFFILFSMVVMGFVMVFEWDALFPDRKDYLILTPLPLGGNSIFAGKMLALVGVPGAFRGRCQLLLHAAGAAGHRRRRHAAPVVWRLIGDPRGERAGGRRVRRVGHRRACKAC